MAEIHRGHANYAFSRWISVGLAVILTRRRNRCRRSTNRPEIGPSETAATAIWRFVLQGIGVFYRLPVSRNVHRKSGKRRRRRRAASVGNAPDLSSCHRCSRYASCAGRLCTLRRSVGGVNRKSGRNTIQWTMSDEETSDGEVTGAEWVFGSRRFVISNFGTFWIHQFT